MRSGFFLFHFLVPIFIEGCCAINYLNQFTGFRQDAAYLHYRAVEGEIFMMPCVTQNMMTVWSRTEEDKETSQGPTFDCGKMFVAEVKHSGKYTSFTGGSKFVFTLQVVGKIALGCFLQNESSVMLRLHAGGTISCPGLTCSNNTGVVWFKESKAVPTRRKNTSAKEGMLQLGEFFREDTGVYFCDRQITEQGVTWMLRRAVNVTVIPHFKATKSPEIRQPSANKTEEVVLGQPHNLTCEVYSDFEVEFFPKVQWFMNYGGNMQNMTLLHMEKPRQRQLKYELSQIILFEVIQTAIIKEVMPQHLNHTYTCIAANTVGNTSATIKLEKKCQVKWPSLVGYPLVSFLVLAGLGITLHVKWLELTIFCRSHFQCGNNKEEKQFDVFLSYVWGSSVHSSAEVARDLILSTRTGCQDHEEDFLNIEGRATQRPLEMLLPLVLEDQWGYRLCLLERDVLPGGAYTNDVLLAIKNSRMLICVLSEDYFNSSSAMFVLESGIQALLQTSALKLLLIWTCGPPSSLIDPDLPLSKLTQRALRVLPSVDWSADESSTTTFWSSLRKAMPI